MYPEHRVAELLDRLASSAPEPGGGAAAALAAATGAALVSMVANLTIGKEKFAAAQNEMKATLARAEALRADLVAAIDRDAESFRQVMAAYRLPRENPGQQTARKQAIDAALRVAARVPAEVVTLCAEVVALSRLALDKGNPQVLSDAAVAALLADAGAQSAALNVRINLKGIADPGFTGPLWDEVRTRLDAIRSARDEVIRIAYERLG
ncbi:MAG: cyclodeaminase/cyclohydrolase family protein [Armatimonadota bacterium]